MYLSTSRPRGKFRSVVERLVQPGFDLLDWIGVSPNLITIAGALGSVSAAGAFAFGHFYVAFVLLTFGGLCDILDGSYARATNRASTFGRFLDSTLDRLSDIALYLGLMAYYEWNHWPLVNALPAAALMVSVLTSYTKARAEGLGLTCNVGIMTRAPRIILLMVGALLGPWWMIVALAMIVGGGCITVIQRIRQVAALTR